MALLNLTAIQLAFGHWPLLAGADFAIEDSERIGLIGRNGTGKSSLLKIIAGLQAFDDGERSLRGDLRIAYVAQEPSLDEAHTIFESVSEGITEAKRLRQQYEDDSARGASPETLAELQNKIEWLDGWTWEQRVATTLTHLALDGERRVGDLSGGMKKRVALAQALVAQPDVLLLDEPTNHLDMDAIEWLEDLLVARRGAMVFITHDRAFLDRVATRIVELDRGLLTSFPGNFAAYEATKAQQLAFEETVNAKADKLLAQEEVWIRKGVEARRTRSVSRIGRLEALRTRRAERRNALGQVRLDVDAGAKSGKLVAEMTDVRKAFGKNVVVNDLNLTVLRGDKLGLIGSNGAGKTTLLKMILGELKPDAGRVRTGTNISVAYFDQLRDGLDLEATLADFISPGSEWIEIAGKRKHVMSYLDDFLFPPERARAPVKTLSGGERNRLLLARLFARPANVLVLDEPTNDLDIDTLELLEQLLADYTGTVFIVSHDRRFIDNVVTSVLVAEGEGVWREYEGGITDWQAQRKVMAAQAPMVGDAKPASVAAPVAAKSVEVNRGAKLSFNEKRELDRLPDEIDAIEKEQASIQETLGRGEIYRTDPAGAKALSEKLPLLDEKLLEKMQRWEALAARAN